MPVRKRSLRAPTPKKSSGATRKRAEHPPDAEQRLAALEAAAEQLVEMVRDLFAIAKEQGRELKALRRLVR